MSEVVMCRRDIVKVLEEDELASAFNEEGFEKCVDYVCENLLGSLLCGDIFHDQVGDFIREMDANAVIIVDEEEKLQEKRDKRWLKNGV